MINLQNMERGQILKLFTRRLNKLGYITKIIKLDVAKVTIIPQHRERLFILCFISNEDCAKFNFNFPQTKNAPLANFLCSKVDSKYYITSKSKLYKKFTENITKSIEDGYLYQYRRSIIRIHFKKCPTLTATMGTGG